MKSRRLIAIVLLILGLHNCAKIDTPGGLVLWGDKALATASYDYKNFNEIIIQDKFDVTIKQGDAYSIKITTNQNLQDFLAVEKNYTLLSVKMKPNKFYKDAVLKAEITLPQLRFLDVSGISKVTIEKFSSELKLKIDVSETSNLSGEILANDLIINAKNGSIINLQGNADFLKVDGMLSTQWQMKDYESTQANIYLSFGSSGTFTLTGQYVAELRGESTINLFGNAKEVRSKVDEGSQIIKN